MLFKVVYPCEILQEGIQPFLILLYTNVQRFHVEFLNTTKLDVVC